MDNRFQGQPFGKESLKVFQLILGQSNENLPQLQNWDTMIFPQVTDITASPFPPDRLFHLYHFPSGHCRKWSFLQLLYPPSLSSTSWYFVFPWEFSTKQISYSSMCQALLWFILFALQCVHAPGNSNSISNLTSYSVYSPYTPLYLSAYNTMSTQILTSALQVWQKTYFWCNLPWVLI